MYDSESLILEIMGIESSSQLQAYYSHYYSVDMFDDFPSEVEM
ncbi:MAG: hypothetical protein RLZZ601_142 [Pseudomonadota bacterium]|jgi:hypothetical protein